MAAPMRARFLSWKLFTRHVHAKTRKAKSHGDHLVRSVTAEEMPMDPVVLSDMQNGKLKARKNPGIMRIQNVFLPVRLEKAVGILMEKYGRANLIKDSQKLDLRLTMRQLPLEHSDKVERKRAIRQKIINKDKLDLEAMSEEEREAYEAELELKCNRHMKLFIESHWKRKDYTAKNGITYLVARLAQNYAVLLQVLSEIWKRDPNYIPKNLYNYGSGLGTLIWATQNNEAWKENISEYYCVDPSPDMNTIARLLLQDGEESGKMHVEGVYFRRNPLSSNTNKYSTVVSAYTLLEYESSKTRLELVKSLWDMAEDYLILVEMGSYAGHRLIQEAKDFLLKMSTEEELEEKAFVFAPCPHQKSCPKFQLEKRIPCAFVANYKPLEIVSKKEDKRKESFTYVIFKKTKVEQKAMQWPRIVDKTSRGSGHIHCRICCPTGELDHIVITKKKHSSELYAVTRRLDLGDYLPAIYTENSQSQNSSRYRDRVAQQQRQNEMMERENNQTSLDQGAVLLSDNISTVNSDVKILNSESDNLLTNSEDQTADSDNLEKSISDTSEIGNVFT